MRRTKIIATLGPATQSSEVLTEMLEKGLDVVRLNFSHGTADDHAARIKTVRDCAAKLNRGVCVLADLQGPKIRIARFAEGSVVLEESATFVLDAELSSEAGDVTQVGIDYKALPQDVSAGDRLLLDDGRLVFDVQKVEGQKIICTVVVGGELSNNKGINRLGGGLSADALTDKDREDLKTAVSLGVDYVAISFPRAAADVELARDLVRAAGGTHVGIIAKIERTEAVEAIDEIIAVSDAVMVARGDLGVEIGDAELPAVQKHIIHRARTLDKAVITATQMMESMIHNAIPTRAEVFDVANAVLDGTDAVMLSAETATGEHPIQVIEAMARICEGAECHRRAQTSRHRLESEFNSIDEAIAMATMYTANHLGAKAIVSLTESGSTPLWMSRIRSGIPIYALSRHDSTRNKVMLYRGVYPLPFNIKEHTRDTVNQAAIQVLKDQGIVAENDRVVLTKGDLVGKRGGTNAMKIIVVE